jgi:hypothetical protein
MLQTVMSLRAHVASLLAKAEFPAPMPVHYMRIPKTPTFPYVVIDPQDSPIGRDSGSNFDTDVLEIHCVSDDPDEATGMLDAVVDDLRELVAARFPVRGGELIECECVDLRSVNDVSKSDSQDEYAASTTWRFKIERPRQK